ncbi:ornithine cyclodeaminase family protein [Mycobacterium sp. pR1184]|uniref:ornithine cyclodeaminase family protein n=1 Tax=Mycobacterium sp. pR1184 TaxID=3238981 RepID=UPI00351B70FF
MVNSGPALRHAGPTGTARLREQPAGSPPRWIDEEDVVALVSLPEVIDAIRDTYTRAAAGDVVAMPKTFASWAGGSMHAIGAMAVSSGLAVSKTWAHTGGGATPLLAAWDVDTGKLLAVIQAFGLGQLRTSAITGTATSILAADRCQKLAVIGSGKQAEGQIAAVAAVREIQDIAIYSPTADHRKSFAEKITEHSGIAAHAADSVAEAVDQADVVVTVTRATEPFISKPMLAHRVHINAVGAITPERAELEAAVVAHARRIVADDVAAARQLSPRELSATSAPHVLSLGSALTGDERIEGDGITIFKALGTGISDLAVAEIVFERATAAGAGRPLSVSPRSQPRLWSN